LHELLRQAGVQPPYVPVGWSAGGLYVRVFARLFPNEIAGMALVESSTPRQIDETPGFRASWEADKRGLPSQYMAERARVWTGWERLMGRCHNEPSDELKNLPPDEFARLVDLYNAKTCRAEYIGGEFGEFVGFETSAKQAGQLTSLGNLPLLIVTKNTEPRKDMTASDLAELEVWSRAQNELMSFSNQSWHVIARGSGHAVHHARPDLLASEIRRLVGYLKGGAVPPFGATTVE
jgi:pimeloyl-ACP methyl ester carboxylesterase